ncbi:MAG: hypothetical protein ABIR30_07655 [Chitinophagaceae bacterium]
MEKNQFFHHFSALVAGGSAGFYIIFRILKAFVVAATAIKKTFENMLLYGTGITDKTADNRKAGGRTGGKRTKQAFPGKKLLVFGMHASFTQ